MDLAGLVFLSGMLGFFIFVLVTLGFSGSVCLLQAQSADNY
jgi:hypothetical protein|tara:strand:- start:949 stop:1071 length:123 start_codon:yes stop_codon:yes gene_type:complete